jgi:hypothetical protein
MVSFWLLRARPSQAVRPQMMIPISFLLFAHASPGATKPASPVRTRLLSIPTYLHDLILELGQEEVDNLVLLDGQRVQVDLLHALDLASLYETAELGDGLPLLLAAVLASASATATAASTSVTTTVASGAEATTSCTTTVSHFV